MAEHRQSSLSAGSGLLPGGELKLVPNQANTLAVVVTCTGFAILFFFLARNGDANDQAAALLIAAVGAAYAARLHPGVTYLKLTTTGMEYRNFLPARFIRWKDVRQFTTFRSKWRLYVGWTYAERYSGHSATGRLSRAVKGVEDGLSENFNYQAEDLACLLEDWRQRHGTTN